MFIPSGRFYRPEAFFNKLLALVAYLAFVAQHLPTGILRLVFSVAVLLLLGVIAGATMKAELRAKLGLILLVPAIHFVYDGIDPASTSLSVLMYVIDVAVLWVGIWVTPFRRKAAQD